MDLYLCDALRLASPHCRHFLQIYFNAVSLKWARCNSGNTESALKWRCAVGSEVKVKKEVKFILGSYKSDTWFTFFFVAPLSPTLLVSCPWPLYWCLGFCDDLEISNISISDLTCCICQILTCVFVRYCCVYLSNIFMCISMIFSCVFLWFKMRLPDTIARRQEGLCLAAISEPRQTLCTLQYNTRCARYEISSIWIFVLFVKGAFPKISFHDRKIFVMLHIHNW